MALRRWIKIAPRNTRGAREGMETLKPPQNPRASADDGHVV